MVFVCLFLFWILINGKINLEIALIGLLVSSIVYLFACKFLNFSIKKDLMCARAIPFMIAYIFVLIFEVIKSNFNVMKVIASNKYDPKIEHFQVDIKSPILRTIYANSITITPGTISILLTEDEYIVHALRSEFAEGIANNTLVKILKKVEGR